MADMKPKRRGIPPGQLKESPYFPERVLKIFKLRDEGLTLKEVGEEMGMTGAGVFHILRRWSEWARAQ